MMNQETEHQHRHKIRIEAKEFANRILPIEKYASSESTRARGDLAHGYEVGYNTAVNSYAELKSKKEELSNLLATIHRDGGHREHEVGTVQAIKDAIVVVERLRDEFVRLISVKK